MASEEVLERWYRAVGDDGAILCETRDAEELIHMCEGRKYEIHVLTRTLVTSDWAQMSKKNQKKLTDSAEANDAIFGNTMRR